MNNTNTIHVTSTIASKHSLTFLMTLPKKTNKNTINKVINILRGVNTPLGSTTWTISKTKIKNSEQESIKQALIKNGINIDFSIEIIKTPKKIINIIFKDIATAHKKNQTTSNKNSGKKRNYSYKYTPAKKKENLIYEQLSLFDMFI